MGIKGVIKNVVGGVFGVGAILLLAPSKTYRDTLEERGEDFDRFIHTRVTEALESKFPSLAESGVREPIGLASLVINVAGAGYIGRKLADLVLGDDKPAPERSR